MYWFIFVFGVCYSQLVYDQRILIGPSKYARVIWDPLTTTSFVYAGKSGNDVFILGVRDGKSDKVFCKRASTTHIVTTPVGCSEYSNYVCSNYDGLNRQRLIDNWNKSILDCPLDNRGDCFGPVYDPGFLVSGLGPSCMIPAITWPKFKARTLQITGHNCSEFNVTNTFTENQRAGFRNVNASIYYENGVYGILYERDFTSLDLNTIKLIKAVGSPYTTLYYSSSKYEYDVDYTNITFISYSTPNISCYVSALQVHVDTPDYSVLEQPTIPTELTYYLEPEIPWYYFTRSCNHYVNRYSYLKETTSTYFPVNVPIGGRPVLKIKITPSEIPVIPILIKPDPRFEHYVSGCEHFYPKSSTFLNEADVLYNRAEPVLYSCYSPFVNLDLISPVDSVTRKFDACYRLGGTVNGLTQDVCVKHQANQRCKKDWLYYDTRCYYKYPSVQRFAFLKGPQREAESICNSLGGTSFITLSADTVQWLLGWYLYYLNDVIKVRVGITGQRCACLYILNGQEINEPCDCNTLEFPLCAYNAKDFPLPFREFAIDPLTMSILRDGQDGLPYNGREITCECEAGSVGKYCEQQTCIAPVDLQAISVEVSLVNNLVKFFLKCYEHGKCHDFRPYKCDCLPGYGPESNLNDDTDLHHDHPCACPAIFVRGHANDYQINENRYSNNTFGVCNNYKAGYCDLNNSAICQSVTVLNLNADASNLFRKIAVYEGKSLACKIPMLLPGSGMQIQRGFCNGHGTCCPSGERLDEQVLSTSVVDLWGRFECQPDIVGCTCDNGYDGESCTSIIPSWVVNSKLTAKGYIQFPYILNVTRIVGISTYEIRLNLDVNCPGCTYGQYLVYTGVKSQQPTNLIQVYTEEFPICGYHAHLYMNRYFANAAWRSCYSAIVQNEFDYARRGSTITNCQCDVNYSGARCGLGVSAVRYELGIWKRYTCGSNVIPRRGFESTDHCNCNAEFGFQGESCQCRHSCGKYGVCKSAKFSYGQCQFDLVSARSTLESDTFSAISAATGSTFYKYSVQSLGGIVMFLTDTYWYFPYLTILDIENYSYDTINLTSVDFQTIPVRLNYSCQAESTVPFPQKVIGYGYGYLNSSQIPTEFILNTNWYPTCNVSIVAYPCVFNVSYWMEMDANSEIVLEEGIYNTSIFASPVMATKLFQENFETTYGKFDCSNVMDLLIESALICMGRITFPQCQHYIHNSTLGEAYGLFWNRHEFIKFMTEPEEWSSAQFGLLRSFLHLNWTDTSWDTYMENLIYRLLNETTIDQSISLQNITVNTVEYNTTTGGSVFAIGYDGNYYRRLTNYTNRRINGLPGYWFSLGSNIFELRQLVIASLPFKISQIAIIAPNGKLCGGAFVEVDVGNRIEINCELGNVPESLGSSLFRALNNNELYLYLNQTWEDWTLWYIPFNSSVFNATWNLEIRYTTTSYSEIWNYLKTSVMIDGVFPYSDPQVNNLTNAEIIDIYKVYLSPRKCTNKFQCRSFGKTWDITDESLYECVFNDDSYKRLWLNGQDKPPVVSLGDEGGCDCRYHVGIWEPTSHCILCKRGYGPLTDEDWYRYVESGLDLNITTRPEDCTIPVSSNGEFCGSHGNAVYNEINNVNVSVPVWTSDTNPSYYITTKCITVVGGYELQYTTHPDVIVYGENNEVVIIQDSIVYVNGQLVQSIECLEERGEMYKTMAYSISDWFLEFRGPYTYWLVPT